MQSSEKKKPKLIDRFDPCLSCLKKKRRKKRNISVSTVHTFSSVLSALSWCQSPASSNSVVTHSHFPVEVDNPISLVWFLCCVFVDPKKQCFFIYLLLLFYYFIILLLFLFRA